MKLFLHPDYLDLVWSFWVSNGSLFNSRHHGRTVELSDFLARSKKVLIIGRSIRWNSWMVISIFLGSGIIIFAHIRILMAEHQQKFGTVRIFLKLAINSHIILVNGRGYWQDIICRYKPAFLDWFLKIWTVTRLSVFGCVYWFRLPDFNRKFDLVYGEICNFFD